MNHIFKFSYLSRLKKYSTMAIVAVAAATVMQADVADAEIVYSGLQNLAVPGNFDGIEINFDRDNPGAGEFLTPAGVYAFGVTNESGNDVALFFIDGPGWIYGTSVVNPTAGIESAVVVDDTGLAPAVLLFGDTIDSTSNFASRTTFDGAPETDPFQGRTADGSYFVGLRTDTGNFGWIQFAGIDDATATATVVDWAFENSGAAITAGATVAVPEPGSLALLGLGAVAFAGRRRRNRS